MYDNNKIDFKFEENYKKNTIERIKNIEKTCSISITNIFNLDNIKNKTFAYNNHPTNYVLKYISIEILKILKIDNVYFDDIKKEVLSELPYSIYSYNYLNLIG